MPNELVNNELERTSNML